MVVEGTGDNFVLLLLGELYEVYSIAADTDGQLGILFGVSLCIQQSFLGKYVYIQMMAALFDVAVQQGNQVVNLRLSCCHVV